MFSRDRFRLLRHFLWILVVAATVVSVPAVAQQPGLSVRVTNQDVQISGVPPRGSIVLISCGRGVAEKNRPYVLRNGILLRDEDGDGRIQHVPSPLPLFSVWVAVDYDSGAAAVGAPASFPLYARPLTDEALRRDVENELAFLEVELPRLILFLVRPGHGAWELFGADASPDDRDGPNGRTKLAFEDAKPVVGKDKAPKHLKKGDVVVAFNPRQLDVLMTQVTK